MTTMTPQRITDYARSIGVASPTAGQRIEIAKILAQTDRQDRMIHLQDLAVAAAYKGQPVYPDIKP